MPRVENPIYMDSKPKSRYLSKRRSSTCGYNATSPGKWPLSRRRPHPRNDRSKIGRGRIGSTLNFITTIFNVSKAIVLNAIAVGLFVVVVLTVWRETPPAVVVADFHVPASLLKVGYSPEVARGFVANTLLEMDAQASASMPRQWQIKPVEPSLSVEVPGSGISVETALRLIKESLGRPDVTITGDVVERGETLHVYVGVRGKEKEYRQLRIDGVIADADDLLRRSAREIMKVVNPNALSESEVSAEDQRCLRAPPCDYSDALDVLDAVLNNRSVEEQKWALIGRGYVYSRMGRSEQAEQQYRRAIGLDAEYAPAYNAWGQLLYELGRPADAMEKFRKATELKPGYAYPYNGLGNCLLSLNRPSDAIEKYHQAISLNPNLAFAFNGQGYALYALKRLEDAAKSFRKAVEIDPALASAVLGLANALQDLGRSDEAIEKYRRATFLDPKSAFAFDGWGNSLYSVRLLEEAVEKFQKATEINPNLASAFNGWGNSLHELGQDEKAIEKYRRAAELDSKQAYAFSGWGNALRSMKRSSEAIEKYRKAIEIDRTLAGAYFGLGEAYSDLKQEMDAREMFRKTIEIGKDEMIVKLACERIRAIRGIVPTRCPDSLRTSTGDRQIVRQSSAGLTNP
jgi:tetratricopeptide (TPR) repeat protein